MTAFLKLLDSFKDTPPAIFFYVLGIAFIALAIVGKIENWIDLNEEKRRHLAVFGVILLLLQLLSWIVLKVLHLPPGILLVSLGILLIVVAAVGKIGNRINLKKSHKIYLIIPAIVLLILGIFLFISSLPDETSKELVKPVEQLKQVEVEPLNPGAKVEKLKQEARKILLEKKRYGIDDARKKFYQAQKIDPKDPQIAYYLAWLDDLNYSIFKKGECQSASKRYKTAMDLFDKNPPKKDDKISREMIVEIGHYLSNRDHYNYKYNKHQDAIDLYNKYILKEGFDISDPVTYMALVSRGMAHFWQRKYGKSERDFEQALSEKVSNQVAYNLGSVYAMFDNYPNAIKWYKSAIYGGHVNLELESNNIKKIELSGELKLDEARRDLGFALLLNDESKNDESKKDQKKRYQKALDEFEQAIKTRENNGESINYSAYVGKGIAQYFLQDVDSAKETLGKVTKITKDNPYRDIATIYLNEINQCKPKVHNSCNNYMNFIILLNDIDRLPILTTKKGIAKMFGNVTVHNEKLDPVLEIEHDALYKGLCK